MAVHPLETLRTALLDRYHVERVLGTGGMATVYLAHDLKHDRPVAIKVLRPELSAVLGRERFLREIQIAAKLTHPNILPLHDSGEAGDLLYYVMPYVTGETLLEKVNREKQLPVEEALRIIRQVATALEYAHQQGVIHRDIKPANILLSDGIPLVADFGLARAISRAQSEGGARATISHSGLTIGTPTYMSPEQASGAEELDGRSDIYSLGCVLYELLAGDPPFTSSNPGAFYAKLAQADVVPIRIVRPSVPVWLERVLKKALEKMPADRFRTAGTFAESLEFSGEKRASRWLLTAAFVGVASIAIVALLLRRPGPPARTHFEPTRFAVLPFDRTEPATGPDLELVLHEALARWSGISLVDRARLQGLSGQGRSPSMDPSEARRIAAREGAGRYLRGEILSIGDSLQVRATLYDTNADSVLIQRTAKLAARPQVGDSGLDDLAEELLFRGRLPRGPAEGQPASRSFRAVESYLDGRQSIQDWELASADSGFARALALDGDFTQAALWLAQVRSWQGLPARTWRLQAERALAGQSRLSPRDSALAGALATLSRQDYPEACGDWRAMTTRWPKEFVVWYGSAVCQALDEAVRRDPSSPSGWTFRSSYHQAQLAWRRAFELMPSVYRDFRVSGRNPNLRLLWTSTNKVRGGQSLTPDSAAFSAFPSWQGDTLAFIPYPDREFFAGKASVAAASTPEAVRQQRRAFYDLASEWRSTAPRSPDSGEALAIGLWLIGNPTAPDTIHAARAATVRLEDQIRLGITEALMVLLQGAPEEGPLKRVRNLIDSLLAIDPVPPDVDPWDRATLTALTGHASATGSLVRQPSQRRVWQLPPGLASDALALLAFASLGGPAESLSVLERKVDAGILAGVGPSGRKGAQMEWLARPVTAAFLEAPFPSLGELTGNDDYLIEAVAAYRRGDTAVVRRRLDEASAGRAWMQPWDLAFETLQPEARLLAAIGDVRGAIERLDPTLSTLRSTSLDVVRQPMGAGMLVRAMILRAELAKATQDQPTAARWARAAEVLWSDADSFLQPIVRRMRQIARSTRA